MQNYFIKYNIQTFILMTTDPRKGTCAISYLSRGHDFINRGQELKFYT